MTFFPMAGYDDWCSPTNTRGGPCKNPISGVCKPMNTASLDHIKAMQNQLNRVAQVKGWSKIRVDGEIGSSTLSLWNKVASLTPLMETYSSCDGLAEITVMGAATAQVVNLANNMGAPANVSGPTVLFPKKPNADPSKPPSDPAPPLAIVDSLFGMVSSPFGLVIAAGLGYAAYRMATGGKKSAPAPARSKPGRRKSASARARRPSRARPARRPSRGRRRRTRR